MRFVTQWSYLLKTWGDLVYMSQRRNWHKRKHETWKGLKMEEFCSFTSSCETINQILGITLMFLAPMFGRVWFSTIRIYPLQPSIIVEEVWLGLNLSIWSHTPKSRRHQKWYNNYTTFLLGIIYLLSKNRIYLFILNNES